MIQRFASKIAWPSQISACWPWAAALDRDGYGTFHVGNKKKLAHRVSYELFLGAVPELAEIDHLCRNRSCVNPLHLQAVSRVVNIMRSQAPPALNARKTHCASGHEFTYANTYRWIRQGRVERSCRACNAAAASRLKARKESSR